MNILDNFGVDYKLLIAQIINFVILLWVLSKFIFQPILKKIETKEKEISDLKTQSENLNAEKAKFEQEKSLQDTINKTQYRSIVEEAETIAQKIKERAQKETEKEKELIISQLQKRSKVNER